MAAPTIARKSRPRKQRVEIFLLPPPRAVAQARSIRHAGGVVPPRLKPKSVGIFDLGIAATTPQGRRLATRKAKEQAARYNATVRSVNPSERGWVASLSKKD